MYIDSVQSSLNMPDIIMFYIDELADTDVLKNQFPGTALWRGITGWNHLIWSLPCPRMLLIHTL